MRNGVDQAERGGGVIASRWAREIGIDADLAVRVPSARDVSEGE
jgi:hypothetical protein